jgi:hypothetical protein
VRLTVRQLVGEHVGDDDADRGEQLCGAHDDTWYPLAVSTTPADLRMAATLRAAASMWAPALDHSASASVSALAASMKALGGGESAGRDVVHVARGLVQCVGVLDRGRAGGLRVAGDAGYARRGFLPSWVRLGLRAVAAL